MIIVVTVDICKAQDHLGVQVTSLFSVVKDALLLVLLTCLRVASVDCKLH